jgi:hypothetical protein
MNLLDWEQTFVNSFIRRFPLRPRYIAYAELIQQYGYVGTRLDYFLYLRAPSVNLIRFLKNRGTPPRRIYALIKARWNLSATERTRILSMLRARG